MLDWTSGQNQHSSDYDSNKIDAEERSTFTLVDVGENGEIQVADEKSAMDREWKYSWNLYVHVYVIVTV